MPEELEAMIACVGVASSIDLGEELDLELWTLRRVLLYEVGVRESLSRPMTR